MNTAIGLQTIRILVAAASLWSCVSPNSNGFGGGFNEFDEVNGAMERCYATDSRASFDIVSNGKRTTFEIDASAAQWPSDAYRRIIGTLYTRTAPCPRLGSRARITRCEGCLPSILSVEIAGRGGTFDEPSRQLWAVRRFVNRQGGPEEYAALFGVSRILAVYNRLDAGSRAVWVRDRLSRALDTYSSEQRATAMIAKFGRPSLLSHARRLVDIDAAHSDEIGVVKALPFNPTESGSAPFVGSWGQFALEVYVEKDGTLKRLL
jgi:hypothetical protein